MPIYAGLFCVSHRVMDQMRLWSDKAETPNQVEESGDAKAL